MMRWRYERFGGIVSCEEPPLLAFVDQDFMRGLGLPESPLWRDSCQSDRKQPDLLTAPTEVHLALTNACSEGCRHCYMDSLPSDPDQLSDDGVRRAFEALAELGVFHVALGGGEALNRGSLLPLARHARQCGLVPNLTISGAGLTEELARQMAGLFGQVNVSLDGVGPLDGVHRGRPRFEQADRGLRLLSAAGVSCGINCVLGKANFDGLGELFEYAAERGCNEVELLRFKPAGRGAACYAEARCEAGQHERLIPLLQELSARTGVIAKIDCSLIPMLCAHSPPIEELQALGAYGCEAGNVLCGVRSDGQVCGCSFLPPVGLHVEQLPERFGGDGALNSLRRAHLSAPEPCRSCSYLSLCKGGCRAVSLHLTGNLLAPDPECPVVQQWEEVTRAEGATPR